MELFRIKINNILIIILLVFLSGVFLFVNPVKIIDNGQHEHRVMRVYDGDTVAVLIDGERESVRLIGIDAPETDNPYTKKECFGDKSKIYLNELLLGKMVELRSDELNQDRDKYKRLLRFIYLNGENINLKIVQDGQARLQYGFEHGFMDEFRFARDSAKDDGLGLWGECEMTY